MKSWGREEEKIYVPFPLLFLHPTHIGVWSFSSASPPPPQSIPAKPGEVEDQAGFQLSSLAESMGGRMKRRGGVCDRIVFPPRLLDSGLLVHSLPSGGIVERGEVEQVRSSKRKLWTVAAREGDGVSG